MTISILSQTQQQYSSAIRAQLGRGHIHAGLLYSQWFRQGKMTAEDPAFLNAQGLFEEICAATDGKALTLVKEVEAGGTTKLLTKTHDDLEVESVVIPMQTGATLCVSSQVGCRMGCVFCETGRMGLMRNLTAEEIVGQVFLARHQLGYSFRNIVFMGMGEPLDNWEAVSQALQVLTDPSGFCWSKNRITISTSGCLEGVERMLEEGGPYVNLAISINAPNDALRDELMPVNRRHNLQAIKEGIQRYCSQTGRQVLVAYVLMQGFNDASHHARELADYLKGLDVKVNLIPYNPQSRDRFSAPSNAQLDGFAATLRALGLRVLVRHNKGRDIMAACGQLGNLKLRRQLRERRSSPK